jgi:hypothetical protein
MKVIFISKQVNRHVHEAGDLKSRVPSSEPLRVQVLCPSPVAKRRKFVFK